jgi:hypothetical protein
MMRSTVAAYPAAEAESSSDVVAPKPALRRSCATALSVSIASPSLFPVAARMGRPHRSYSQASARDVSDLCATYEGIVREGRVRDEQRVRYSQACPAAPSDVVGGLSETFRGGPASTGYPYRLGWEVHRPYHAGPCR